MKFSVLDTVDPHYNLAVEEYLFNTSQEEVFLLWQNSPTVVIGKNQNAFTEINMEVLEKSNVKIARRITGGGAVYHDEGNVNYSFIAPNAKTEGIDFSRYAEPILNALKTLGLTATLSGRNDILVGDKKISGNAQHRVGSRVLHHGTLLYSSDLEFLSSVLKVDKEKLTSKAVKSTRSRVENIKNLVTSKMDVSSFIGYLSSYIIKRYNPEILPIIDNAEIQEIYNRNKSIGWLFPDRDMVSKYTKSVKNRYEFGMVCLQLSMNNGVIESVKIEGDFFGVLNAQELEKHLSGVTITELKNKLSTVKISDYIQGMSNAQFEELIAR